MGNKKERKIDLNNNDLECILFGLMGILVCAIILNNNGPIGNFFTYIFTFLFGAFYFVLITFVLFLSIYLIIRKRRYKVRHKLTMTGLILIYFSLLIATSVNATEVRFNNLIEVFNGRLATVSSSFPVIDSFGNIGALGGGFIGYTLKALLNSVVTEVGTMVIYIILLILGLALSLKDVIVQLIRFFKNTSYSKKEKAVQNNEPTRSVSLDEKHITQEDNKLLTSNNDERTFTTFKVKEETSTIPVIEKAQTNEFEVKNDTYFNKQDFEETKKETPTNEVEELDIPKREEPKPQIKNYFGDEDEFEIKQNSKPSYFEEPEVKETPNVEEKVEEVVSPTFESKVEETNEYKANENEATEEVKKEPFEFKQQVNEFKVPEPEVKQVEAPQTQEVPKPKKKYVLPGIDLLDYHPHEDTISENKFVAEQRVEKINNTFNQFKIGAHVVSYTIGPSVTRFNIKMNEGVRVNTLAGITNEISTALNGDKSVRLEMIVEGRDTSSIEVGNKKVTPVSFIECFESIKDKLSPKDKLLIPLGKDIENHTVTTSLDELPHLLVAGTTGSGKSVFVNTIIATLIMRNTPSELRLMLVDPKKVEFTRYQNLPHLLCPIITESKEAAAGLVKLCEEMDARYAQLSFRGVAKISEYNELAERKGFEKMSNIVLVIDEFADLLTNNAKEINLNVQRLCQKARAAGIYLIICTQRPSVNVITGDIKAVIPSRIGLLVPSAVDSRTILDQQGAESLLGNGDMLCQIPHHSSLVRVQGAYISGVEIAEICNFIKAQAEVEYDPKFCNLIKKTSSSGSFDVEERKLELDELHEEAKAHVIECRIASTSNLQSYFSIGYARADHILNCLEQEGVVKRVSGNRRIVVINKEDSDQNEQ